MEARIVPGVEEKIRLQVHVDDELARRIESLASGMNRSLAWMIAELLIEAVAQRQRFVDWITWRIVKVVGLADPRKLRLKFRNAVPRPMLKGTVYLQTQVSVEVANELEKLAAANQRTRADMCTLLLNWVMDDGEWLIRAATNRWASAMYDGLKMPRCEQASGNREENRGRKLEIVVKQGGR
jgi:predicted transcriptional regulator